jgi:hypothetical protein
MHIASCRVFIEKNKIIVFAYIRYIFLYNLVGFLTYSSSSRLAFSFVRQQSRTVSRQPFMGSKVGVSNDAASAGFLKVMF